MADIFEEVEEGLRQDKAARLWKKYGVFAYLAAALLIGGVALYQYMDQRKADTIEKDAMAFEAALDDLGQQNFAVAGDKFQQLAEADSSIAPLAANFLAGARLAGNADKAAAIKALESAANAETPIGKLSLIKAAYLLSETMSRAELETYLGPLIDEDSQFSALSLELVASKAVQEGDTDYAREVFSELRFLANVPPGVDQRAREALATLPPANPDAAGTETEAASDADAAPIPTDEPAAPTAAQDSDDGGQGDQPE